MLWGISRGSSDRSTASTWQKKAQVGSSSATVWDRRADIARWHSACRSGPATLSLERSTNCLLMSIWRAASTRSIWLRSRSRCTTCLPGPTICMSPRHLLVRRLPAHRRRWRFTGTRLRYGTGLGSDVPSRWRWGSPAARRWRDSSTRVRAWACRRPFLAPRGGGRRRECKRSVGAAADGTMRAVWSEELRGPKRSRETESCSSSSWRETTRTSTALDAAFTRCLLWTWMTRRSPRPIRPFFAGDNNNNQPAKDSTTHPNLQQLHGSRNLTRRRRIHRSPWLSWHPCLQTCFWDCTVIHLKNARKMKPDPANSTFAEPPATAAIVEHHHSSRRLPKKQKREAAGVFYVSLLIPATIICCSSVSLPERLLDSPSEVKSGLHHPCTTQQQRRQVIHTMDALGDWVRLSSSWTTSEQTGWNSSMSQDWSIFEELYSTLGLAWIRSKCRVSTILLIFQFRWPKSSSKLRVMEPDSDTLIYVRSSDAWENLLSINPVVYFEVNRYLDRSDRPYRH